MKATFKIKEGMWAGLSEMSSGKNNSYTEGETVIAEAGSDLISQLKNTAVRKSLGIKSTMMVIEIDKDFVLIKIEGLKDVNNNKSANPPHYMFQVEKKDLDTKASRVLKLTTNEEHSFVTTQSVTDAGLYYSIKLLEII